MRKDVRVEESCDWPRSSRKHPETAVRDLLSSPRQARWSQKTSIAGVYTCWIAPVAATRNKLVEDLVTGAHHLDTCARGQRYLGASQRGQAAAGGAGVIKAPLRWWEMQASMTSLSEVSRHMHTRAFDTYRLCSKTLQRSWETALFGTGPAERGHGAPDGPERMARGRAPSRPSWELGEAAP
uniref:Uncharacterized protein n=1 Tax=Knipowitschia caucasica TaxID=637954 RepID=A0AAV2LPN1_KNICA